MAKAACKKMGNILKNRSINIKARVQLLKCYVWSILLYGSETWINAAMYQRLQATETCFFRKMLRIPWTKKVTNEKVLEKAQTGRSLMKALYQRQLKFFGHVMRKKKLEHPAITGKTEGSRARERQRRTYLDAMAEVTNTTRINILRLVSTRARNSILTNPHSFRIFL